MCKKRPEPRCAHHAKEAIKKARSAIALAESSSDSNALAQARADYDQARWDYYTTPTGQQFLKDRADKERIDNPEGAAELDKLYERAVAARNEQTELARSMRLGSPRAVQKVMPADADFPAHEIQSVIDGQPIGYIQWDHASGDIIGIDVLPEHRGRGVAQDLVKQAEDVAQKNGWVSPTRTQDMDENGDWVAGIHDVADRNRISVKAATPTPTGWSDSHKREILSTTVEPLKQDALFLSEANRREVSPNITTATCDEVDHKLQVFMTKVNADPALSYEHKERYTYYAHQSRQDVQALRSMFSSNATQESLDTATRGLRQHVAHLSESIVKP